ncbi:MAG: hypothetical protein ACO3PV_08640, partial [Pseudohongiellaceae bacterium]
MAITTSTSGIGSLTNVAWTPLDGTGLSPQQTDSVSDQVEAAAAIAKALLAAVRSAFNRGMSQFSLDDLAELGHLSTLATGDDTAGEWAAFIGSALRRAPAADQARSFGEWRRMAADLQQYAALQASRRDATWGVAGGVTHANGQWYANGQALSLLDLFTAVRVNQVANHDDALDGFMRDLEANNRRLTAARAWMALLANNDSYSTFNFSTRYYNGNTTVYHGSVYQANTFIDFLDTDPYCNYDWGKGKWFIGGAVPTNTKYWSYANQFQISSSTRAEFMAEWGFDPITEFHQTAVTFDSPINAQNRDIYINDIKTYIDLKDTDNQKLQQQAQQKENRRSEVLEALS